MAVSGCISEPSSLAMGKISHPVEIGADGWGEFVVDGGSVSVWVSEEVGQDMYITM